MKKQLGYVTLIEMMIIVCIIGILAAVVVPRLKGTLGKLPAATEGMTRQQQSTLK
ncbi:hypothetical protein LP414_27480 [Polaromonas sp. P1(28)-13]|nr:hypothetical protein LP414_27480 [Polaromonas sp. P1(28)-13]